MDHAKGGTFLVVSTDAETLEPRITIQREINDPAEARKLAEDLARHYLHEGAKQAVAVYQRMWTFDAKVEVTMRREGE